MKTAAEKKKLVKRIIAAVVAVALVGIAVLVYWLCFRDGGTILYTQVDNSRVTHVHSSGGVIDLTGGLEYSYTLPAYKGDGSLEDVTFGMSRQLREGAFLCLRVVPIRGVVEWSEVEYGQLPEAVRRHYADPAEGGSAAE